MSSVDKRAGHNTMTVGITGVHGLIGWHLRANLHGRPDVQVRGADRATFSDPAALDDMVAASDVIVHLAGMNRGDDAELEETNVVLADALISACERTGRRPHIIFASSTHIALDTPYGRSKRKCAERFRSWSERTGGVFANLILPHVYGEGGKPFYNSVVSTFCHQLANGQVPQVIQDGALELVHAQQVAEQIWTTLSERHSGDVRVPGTPMRVSELLSKLQRFDELYGGQIVPDLRQELDLYLFNTYRSYRFPQYYPVSLELHQDDRGSLFEAIKSLNGGQCFVSTTKPGITRGNHYHSRKIERFLVVGGRGVIRLRKLFSDDVTEFEVSGDQPRYVDMPTFHTHSITNVGDSVMTVLFWSNEIFDSSKPDTFSETV